MKKVIFDKFIDFKVFFLIMVSLFIGASYLRISEIKITDVTFDRDCRVSFVARSVADEDVEADLLVICHDLVALKPAVYRANIIGQKLVKASFKPHESKMFQESIQCLGSPKSVDVVVQKVQ